MDERVETFAPPASREEVLTKALGVTFGFGMGFAGAIDGGIGQAQDHASDHPQHPGRIGRAHAAQILLHGDVQTVMQSALNHPITPFELEHPLGLQLIQSQTAQQIDHFARALAPALDPGLQPRGQSGSRKAHLAGRHLQRLQETDFESSPIVFAP